MCWTIAARPLVNLLLVSVLLAMSLFAEPTSLAGAIIEMVVYVNVV